MASLRVFVCFLGLVVLCQAVCEFEELGNKDSETPPKGCVAKDGTPHNFGSEWVKDCIACSCSKEGIRCCSMIPEPDEVADIPEECELVEDKKTCSAKIVLKSDKTKDCIST